MTRPRRVACVAATLAAGAILLLPVAPATAAPRDAALIAAAESPEGGQLPGPEPNEESPFAPQEYQTPWTWWMGVLLAVAGAVAALYVGLGYYFLVKRPRDRARQM
ncbi:MAG: hypothetical protein ACRDUY_08545 [Nitriliruptorales bacterium]